MKAILLTLVYTTVLFCTDASYAQNACSQSSKGISTHPDNPRNTEKPTKRNTFDWRTPSYYTNATYVVNNPVPSPFYKDDNFNVSHFLDNKDMQPQDGWEIIKYDFGTPSRATDYVYMVLYNKYLGKLRVFLTGKDRAYNGQV